MDRARFVVGGDTLGPPFHPKRFTQNTPAKVIERFLLCLFRKVENADTDGISFHSDFFIPAAQLRLPMTEAALPAERSHDLSAGCCEYGSVPRRQARR